MESPGAGNQEIISKFAGTSNNKSQRKIFANQGWNKYDNFRDFLQFFEYFDKQVLRKW